MNLRKSLGNFGEVVAATAAMVAIAFFLWGFYLNVKIVADLGGFWATIASGLLYPLVFFVVPWYAGFALGDWAPFWISYVAFWCAACTASVGAILRLKLLPAATWMPPPTEDRLPGLDQS